MYLPRLFEFVRERFRYHAYCCKSSLRSPWYSVTASSCRSTSMFLCEYWKGGAWPWDYVLRVRTILTKSTGAQTRRLDGWAPYQQDEVDEHEYSAIIAIRLAGHIDRFHAPISPRFWTWL